MGTFTIKEVFENTKEKYDTRFDYYKRDVVKRIQIKEIKEIQRHDKPGEPRERSFYHIISKSWPQYPPYLTKKDNKGRLRTTQRTIAHEYDVMIEMDELSLTTKEWRMRVGSGKKWVKKPPQNQLKSLYPETKKSLQKKATRKASTQKEAKSLYKEYVEKHKKNGKYLDIGDYNSRVNGLNADFIFRCSFAYWRAGHLWGRNYYGNVPAPIRNPQNIVFFTKHQINVLTKLMEAGVLKR